MNGKEKNAILEMGNRFKAVRTMNGYTQEQIARFLDVDRTLITKFEKGERALGIADLERACGLFGCDLKTLRGLKEYRPLTVAYRAKDLSLEDMESVRKVQKIILNMRRIKAYGKDSHEDRYTT